MKTSFRERAIDSMFEELKQLNDGKMPSYPVVGPINSKRRGLEAVNIIKGKINGMIKLRSPANELKQKFYLKVE